MECEPVLDHAPRAEADERPQHDLGTGPRPTSAEHVVGRVDEVGRGIDQRAVEVEDHGGTVMGVWLSGGE